MKIHYRNLNVNANGDGVTGSMSEVTVIRDNYPNYRCIIDFGAVQNQSLSIEQLYKINARNLPLGGDYLANVKSVPINDILISHC